MKKLFTILAAVGIFMTPGVAEAKVPSGADLNKGWFEFTLVCENGSVLNLTHEPGPGNTAFSADGHYVAVQFTYYNSEGVMYYQTKNGNPNTVTCTKNNPDGSRLVIEVMTVGGKK